MYLLPISSTNYKTTYVKRNYSNVSFGQERQINSNKPETTPINFLKNLYTKGKQCVGFTYKKIGTACGLIKPTTNEVVTEVNKVSLKKAAKETGKIPEFKPSFDIVLLKNIVKKQPEITPEKIKHSPRSVLTILNASGTAIVCDGSSYKDIGEFNELFPSYEQQAEIIKCILKTPNLVENAEKKIQEEKKAYIDSIWQDYLHVETPFVPFNKERNVQGLKALQKYGTNEDLKRLHDEYSICKDNDIFLEYVKLINKVGKDYDDFYNIDVLVSETDRGKYNDAIMEEAIKGVKKYLVDEAPKGRWTNAQFYTYKNFEYYAQRAKEQGKPEMEANARAIMARIVEDNPWMQGKIDRLRNENKQ